MVARYVQLRALVAGASGASGGGSPTPASRRHENWGCDPSPAWTPRPGASGIMFDHVIRVWDVRNLKCVQTLSTSNDESISPGAGPVTATCFDAGREADQHEIIQHARSMRLLTAHNKITVWERVVKFDETATTSITCLCP